MTGVHDDAVAIAPGSIALRRAIHQEPEIGNDLAAAPRRRCWPPWTGLPLEVTVGRPADLGQPPSLRGRRPRSRRVLLRGDMDALPVTERSSASPCTPRRSTGAMHACGHDTHTAMLAGAARLLCARRAELPGSVIFMFQPGEEGFHGAET